MSTTLETELEQGAAALAYVARLQRASGNFGVGGNWGGRGGAEEWEAHAARLRQRAAWVGKHMRVVDLVSPDGAAFARDLTGPIPAAEAATTGGKP